MDKVQLVINNLTYSHSQTGAYVLELMEANGHRSIPIVIGAFEAQSIALELEGMSPGRPLTHDLFKSFAESFDISMLEVLIDELEEGIFHSKLIFQSNSEIKSIDARTSDAIALALRFKCPIFALKNIIETAGITREEYNEANQESDATISMDINSPEMKIRTMTVEQLDEMLNKAIDDEDYEMASKVRDELNRRNQK